VSQEVFDKKKAKIEILEYFWDKKNIWLSKNFLGQEKYLIEKKFFALTLARLPVPKVPPDAPAHGEQDRRKKLKKNR
jgi:hypothetical protein